MMYPKKHSYLSPKCEARRDSAIHRFGVFAKVDIKEGELIAVWGGSIMTRDEVDTLPEAIKMYPLQVYTDLYLGVKTVDDLDDAEMFNHSCSPNAGVKGQSILVARRDIQAGEEICFDYETTCTEGMLLLQCNCGSIQCRHIIDGTAWKNPAFQKAHQGYFSWYIEEKIAEMRPDLP